MAQETFLSAFLSIKTNKTNKTNNPNTIQINNIKSWLCKIAVNKCIDFKRKQAKTLSREDELEFEIPDKINIENYVENKIRDEKLNRIITNLPEKYINAIHAFYFERMSVKEIAKQYNLPEKTVETQLYRAKKLIKERWGEYEEYG